MAPVRVEYTLAGLDVLLRRIGWSIRVPTRRAAEWDEVAIAVRREEDCAHPLGLRLASEKPAQSTLTRASCQRSTRTWTN